MSENVKDPRSDLEVAADIVDISPGFVDILQRHNLIGDYKGRTLTAKEAIALAREAYENGALEYRNNPEVIDALQDELVDELISRS